jgi:hypothetical protein
MPPVRRQHDWLPPDEAEVSGWQEVRFSRLGLELHGWSERPNGAQVCEVLTLTREDPGTGSGRRSLPAGAG